MAAGYVPASEANETGQSSYSTSNTESYTPVAGSGDEKVIFTLFVTTDDVTGVTIDGNTMALVGTTVGMFRTAKTYEADAPSTGSALDIDWTRSAGSGNDYEWTAITVEDAGTPEAFVEDEADTASPYDVDVAGVASDSLVYGVCEAGEFGDHTLSVGDGQTELFNQGAVWSAKATSYETGSGTVTHSYTDSDPAVAGSGIHAFEIPSAGGGAPAAIPDVVMAPMRAA